MKILQGYMLPLPEQRHKSAKLSGWRWQFQELLTKLTWRSGTWKEGEEGAVRKEDTETTTAVQRLALEARVLKLTLDYPGL